MIALQHGFRDRNTREPGLMMDIDNNIFDIQNRNRQGRVLDTPSRNWVYRLLPRRFWPYAQLARYDRPIGWQLLLWPCWWSAALAAVVCAKAGMKPECIPPLLWHLVLFLVGAIAMRGAGCTYNDLVDQRIDGVVERTRSRPLPSGQVSRLQAVLFMVLQSLAGLLVLTQFNCLTIILGLASLVIVALYPFMKRVIDWPQLFLGLAFNWGALLGWTASTGSLDWPPVLLYLGAIFWTIGYDTIYAHQDKEDDALIGIRSTARLFGRKTKPALFCLYGLMLVFTVSAFAIARIPMITLSGVILAATHMFYQIKALDIDRPDACLRLFRSNSNVGVLIFLGLVLSILWITVV